MKETRPPIVIELAKAREKFEPFPQLQNEHDSCRVLLGFFARNKFWTSDQAAFARKLIKLSQSVRTQ